MLLRRHRRPGIALGHGKLLERFPSSCFSVSPGPHNRPFKGVAQFAIGAIYKKHGETQKAIDVYKQIYDRGGYSKAAVAYELASLYEANKQPDQAKDFYQKLVSEFPDSPFRQNADDALKRLGATAPPAGQKPS